MPERIGSRPPSADVRCASTFRRNLLIENLDLSAQLPDAVVGLSDAGRIHVEKVFQRDPSSGRSICHSQHRFGAHNQEVRKVGQRWRQVYADLLP